MLLGKLETEAWFKKENELLSIFELLLNMILWWHADLRLFYIKHEELIDWMQMNLDTLNLMNFDHLRIVHKIMT